MIVTFNDSADTGEDTGEVTPSAARSATFTRSTDSRATFVATRVSNHLAGAVGTNAWFTSNQPPMSARRYVVAEA